MEQSRFDQVTIPADHGRPTHTGQAPERGKDTAHAEGHRSGKFHGIQTGHSRHKQGEQAHSKSGKADAVHFAAWSCALAPEAVEDYALAIRLARKACEETPNSQQYLNGLGAILMRAGEYEQASEQLKKALALSDDEKTSPSYTRYFLAMTEHHLGNSETAQEHLTQANASAAQELAGSSAWNRKLTLELLRREAEALISNEEK